MTTCYYKETFILGIFATLFIIGAIIVYGDMIIGWLRRIIKVLK